MPTMVRPFLLASTVLSVGVLTTFAGCSSSNKTSPSTDAGGVKDSSTDTGVTHPDGSSGIPDSSSGEDTGVDSGSNCPYSDTFPPAGFPAYATPAKGSGACTASDISAFIAACIGSSASASGCNTWFTTNSALASAAGDAGTACGNCLFNPTNPALGGVYYTATPSNNIGFDPNYGACYALVDTTNGPACAAAFDNINACDEYLCGDCAAAQATTCEQGLNGTGGACATDLTTFNTACATDYADGGIADTTCAPTHVFDPSDTTLTFDFEFVANLVCGTGSTTFTPPADGGDGG